MSNKKLDWAEYREDGDWVNLNIEKNKSPMEEIVLFDDSKNNELVVVDETLYLLEKKKNDSDIKQKEPLYKRILKKFIRPVAVTGLVASSLFCLSGEEKEMPVLDQRQPDLEQLVDYEKERLQRPVRVKRSLKVGKAKLCKSVEGKCKEIKEIVKGEEGNFYVSIDLDLEGLRNKKLVKKIQISMDCLHMDCLKEKIDVDSTVDEISFSKNGKNEFVMPFGINRLGKYNKKFTFQYQDLSDEAEINFNVVGCDIKNGYCVTDKGLEEIMIGGGDFQLNNFEFCGFVDKVYNCIAKGNKYALGDQVHFKFEIDSDTQGGELILVEDYQVRDPKGKVVLSFTENKMPLVHLEKHFDKANINVKDHFTVGRNDAPGKYFLELKVKTLPMGEEKVIFKEFTMK